LHFLVVVVSSRVSRSVPFLRERRRYEIHVVSNCAVALFIIPMMFFEHHCDQSRRVVASATKAGIWWVYFRYAVPPRVARCSTRSSCSRGCRFDRVCLELSFFFAFAVALFWFSRLFVWFRFLRAFSYYRTALRFAFCGAPRCVRGLRTGVG